MGEFILRGDDGLTPFESSLDEVMRRMGLPDPEVMSVLSEEWADLAGDPWQGRSRPVTVHGRTLVVEASTASMVAFLKYGKHSLLEALSTRFGEGVIEDVDIRLPGR